MLLGPAAPTSWPLKQTDENGGLLDVCSMNSKFTVTRRRIKKGFDAKSYMHIAHAYILSNFNFLEILRNLFSREEWENLLFVYLYTFVIVSAQLYRGPFCYVPHWCSSAQLQSNDQFSNGGPTVLCVRQAAIATPHPQIPFYTGIMSKPRIKNP